MQTDFMAAREGSKTHINGAPFNRYDIRETEEPNFAAVLKSLKSIQTSNNRTHSSD